MEEIDHDPLWLPVQTHPLKEEQETPCPLCGTILRVTIGYVGEDDYEGYTCPKGCDLWEYYS